VLTLFNAPTYSDDTLQSLSMLCTRNVSQLTSGNEFNISAVLTFDGDISMSTHMSKLSSAADDTVEFLFTADDLRGQFGKWVRTSFTAASCLFAFLKIRWNSICCGFVVQQIHNKSNRWSESIKVLSHRIRRARCLKKFDYIQK